VRVRTSVAGALVFAIACSAGTYSYLDSRPGSQGPSEGAPEVLGTAEGRTSLDEIIAAPLPVREARLH
jgi:hypothetical protein